MKTKALVSGEVLEHAFSITELAEILGRGRKTVAAIVRPLEPTPGSSRTRKNYSVLNLLRALSGPQDLDISQLTPAERRAHWQAENERLKFETAIRSLIPSEDCRREYSYMAKAVVMVLETLPDILERDCALSPLAVKVVQDKIDDLRDEMARAVENAHIIFGPETESAEISETE